MLRQETGARLKVFRLAKPVGLNCDRRADCIAVALCAAQAEADGCANRCHGVVQDTKLRSVAILQQDLEAPVVIDVCKSEAAAIFGEVEPDDPGRLAECAVAIVDEEDISRIPVPCAI